MIINCYYIYNNTFRGFNIYNALINLGVKTRYKKFLKAFSVY